MNLGKARDYFSSYYEGSLDQGLKQSFEARLQEDAQLQAEYRAFERTMSELNSLQNIEVELPADLHERISARLDKHVWEQKQQAKPALGLGAWWKGLIAGSVAAAGMFFALYQFNAPRTDSASFVNVGTAKPEFTNGADGINMNYAAGGKTVTIKNSDGSVLETLKLGKGGLENKPLKNESVSAQLLSIEVEGSKKATVIVLPGTKAERNVKGAGTLKDFAKALAGFYRMPIVLDVKSSDIPVQWDFTNNPDIVSAARNALADPSLNITQAEPGLKIEKDN